MLRHRGDVAKLRPRIEAQAGAGQPPLMVILDGGWDETGLGWLARHSAVRSGRVVPVAVAGAAELLRILAQEPARRAGALVTPRPWGEAMLRHWLQELGLAALDERPLRLAILEATGGVPERLSRLRRDVLSRIESTPPAGRIEEVRAWGSAHRLLPRAAGIDGALAAGFARLAEGAATGALSADDLAHLVGPEEALLVPALDALGLVEQVPEGLVLSPLGRLAAA